MGTDVAAVKGPEKEIQESNRSRSDDPGLLNSAVLKEILLKDAVKIILGGITIYAYLVAFLYQTLYLISFGIPVELVSLTNTTIIRFWLLFGFLGLVCFSPWLMVMKARPVGPVWRRLAAFLPLVGFVCFTFLVYTLSWLGPLLFALPVFYFYWAVVYPLRQTRDVKGFKARPQESAEKVQTFPRKQLDYVSPVVIILLLLYIPYAAWRVGRNIARTPGPRLVLQLPSQPELVVLYTDGNLFVCEPLREPGQQQNQAVSLVLLDRSALSQGNIPLKLKVVQFRELCPLLLVPELKQ
ncbi:MAG TPA: hypothetical protein VG206_10150 [Terriglobia bacterium]|nr:hypothetical protein [Terriglobia bacterium]